MMFQTEIDEGGSFVSFALQQVAACILSVVWALLTTEIPWDLSSPGGGNALEALSVIALSFGPAAMFGWAIQQSMPRVAASGRWIWLLPCLFGLALLLSSLHRASFMRELSGLFYPEAQGEAWWAVMLFTYPTLGSLGYSLGIIFRARYEEKRSQRKTDEDGKQSPAS
jgi:hypothetical protein